MKTMSAVWYEKNGTPEVLQFGETAMPHPAANEVLVKVCASGVNPSDVKTRAGARGEMSFARQIPHSDGAGIIEATGRNISESRIGERVWLWNAAIKRSFGTCAQYIALPAKQVVPLDSQTSFTAGACFGVPLMTAVYGACSGEKIKGKTILITGGAGAVGFYAIQAAKFFGAKVITTVSNEEKKAHAALANPDNIINYKSEDVAERVLEITDGAGVDRIMEVEFGGNAETSLKVIKPGGVIVGYGSAACPTPALPFYPLMFKNISLRMFLIYGIGAIARKKTITAIQKMEPHLIHAVAKTHPLSKTAEAHQLVESGKVIGNIVVEN